MLAFGVAGAATCSLAPAHASEPAPGAAPAAGSHPEPDPGSTGAPPAPAPELTGPGAPVGSAPTPAPANGNESAATPPAAPTAGAVPIMVLSTPLTEAMIHIAADYPGTWLEQRSIVDGGEWQRVCLAPCDRRVPVDGMEARMTAPGMITSNAFRIAPGTGVARLRVSGGSQTTRDIGLTLLIAGLPVTFGGMAAFGIGATQDKSTLQTVGIVGLVAGGLAVVTSLPLLVSGSTNVRNQDGDSIAATDHAARF
jgi:hypothetical protein